MTQIYRIQCPIPFPLNSVNCYFINDSRPTLIDAGMHADGNFESMSQDIKKAGGNIVDLKRIIITHGHTDHAGLAEKIARISGAEVFIHAGEYPKFIGADKENTKNYFDDYEAFLVSCAVSSIQANMMKERFSLFVENAIFPLSTPTLLFGGEVFAFDDFELRVVNTPGHTAGSISLYNENDGILFSGDILLEHITPNPITEVGLVKKAAEVGNSAVNGFNSLKSFYKTMDVISEMNIDRVYPGHGAWFSESRKRTEVVKAHMKRWRDNVVHLIKRNGNGADGKNGMTLVTLARKMFPSLKETELFLALSEAYAYMNLLVSEDRLTVKIVDGRISFWLNNG